MEAAWKVVPHVKEVFPVEVFPVEDVLEVVFLKVVLWTRSTEAEWKVELAPFRRSVDAYLEAPLKEDEDQVYLEEVFQVAVEQLVVLLLVVEQLEDVQEEVLMQADEQLEVDPQEAVKVQVVQHAQKQVEVQLGVSLFSQVEVCLGHAQVEDHLVHAQVEDR